MVNSCPITCGVNLWPTQPYYCEGKIPKLKSTWQLFPLHLIH